MTTSDTTLRVRIAEAQGWEHIHEECHPAITYLWGYPRVNGQLVEDREMLPDYPNDLNACAQFEAGLNQVRRVQYCNHIDDIIRKESPVNDVTEFDRIHASARIKCLAYLATVNTEAQP